jgi:hypothetical protein
METVDVSREAKEIEGETVCSRLIIRSTERKPSTWDATSGLLSKGALYDKDEGYFEVRAKKEGDLLLLWGEKTKEP